ncbi:hypothetical protein M758_8G184200 [Ceratodon purpureus]|nr:hypothetical protein M758_8G184200 [Ceratodon purpureus]
MPIHRRPANRLPTGHKNREHNRKNMCLPIKTSTVTPQEHSTKLNKILAQFTGYKRATQFYLQSEINTHLEKQENSLLDIPIPEPQEHLSQYLRDLQQSWTQLSKRSVHPVDCKRDAVDWRSSTV